MEVDYIQYLNCQGTIAKGGINNGRLLIFYGGSSNIYAEVGSATRIGQESGPMVNEYLKVRKCDFSIFT